MTLIDRLITDHTFFRDYLERLQETARTLPAEAGFVSSDQITHEFSSRIRRHARIENEILFPALQRVGSNDHRVKTVAAFLLHGKDEHASIAKRQAEFHSAEEKNHPENNWRKRLGHFAEGLQLHMKKEEDEVFPLAQALLSADQLTDLDKKAEKIP